MVSISLSNDSDFKYHQDIIIVFLWSFDILYIVHQASMNKYFPIDFFEVEQSLNALNLVTPQ